MVRLILAATLVFGPLIGIASYYDFWEGQAAAGPALRTPGWRDSVAAVCAYPFHPFTFRCVVVRLTDFCSCHRDRDERLIDLSREDFAKLRSPSAGIVRVILWPS